MLDGQSVDTELCQFHPRAFGRMVHRVKCCNSPSNESLCAAGNRARAKKLQGRRQGASGATPPVRYNEPVGFVSSGVVDPYQVERAVIQPALRAVEAPDLASGQPQLPESALEPQLLQGMSPAQHMVGASPLPDVMEEEAACLTPGELSHLPEHFPRLQLIDALSQALPGMSERFLRGNGGGHVCNRARDDGAGADKPR